jgi:putative ABC transport system permease protein
LSQLLADLRHALRLHARRPGFTLAVVAVLALGLGACIAVFSLVQALLLRPLPFADPGRLVQVWVEDRWSGLAEEPASFPLYRDVAARVRGLEGVAAYWSLPTGFHLSGADGSPEGAEQLAGAFVTANFFDLLGVRPALGRGFLPEDEAESAAKVVALSDRLWRRRFGADPGILGRTVTLNGFPGTVVAVLPPGFDLPRGIELWRPIAFPPQMLADREPLLFQMIARLRPEVALAAARAELADLARQLEVEHPHNHRGHGLRAVPLAEQLLGRTRPALLLLAGAVAVVLLLSAANVAGLLLARAAAREREMAVRSALGAGPGRLLRQTFAESALLALTGGAAGLLGAWLLLRAVAGVAARELPGLAPELIATALDGWAVVFGLAISLATGLLAGLAPALHAWRSRVFSSLRRTAGASSGGGGLRGDRAGAALVVAEVALAVVLLAGAGLLLQSFRTVAGTDLGFAPERLLTMKTNVHRNRLPEAHRVQELYGQMLARVAAVPGVESAGLATTFFLPDPTNASAGYMAAEGRPPAPVGERNLVLADGVTPGFFRTVGLPLLAGRDVGPSDGPGAPAVAVVSAELARRVWPGEGPGEDPLGRRLRFVDSARQPLAGPLGEWITVVGVVGDARRTGPEAEPLTAVYLPLSQLGERLVTLAVRCEPEQTGDPELLAAAIRREARALDPELAFFDVATVEQQVGYQLAARRASTGLLTLFAAFALGLAGLGVYALLAHAVSRSRRELGIRLALGADRATLVRHVAGRAVQLTLGGLALGILAALAAGRALSSQLVGISAVDPRPYALVGVVLVLAALLAALPPALRAARVDPQESLRSE